jgi:hypothetical protein
MSDAALPPASPDDWTRGAPEQPAPPLALLGIAYFAPLYEYAALADRKASFFMSAGGLMLTVLGFFLERIVALCPVSLRSAWIVGGALAVLLVLVVLAGVIAYVAFARLLPPTPPSLAVFRDIARRTLDEYARDVRALSHEQAFTDMLKYNHVVAHWAAGKFRLVNRALAMLQIAIPLWMVLLVALAISG